MAPVPTKMTPATIVADAASGLPETDKKKAPPSPPIHSTSFSTPPSTPPMSTTTPNGFADKTADGKAELGNLGAQTKQAGKGKQESNSKPSITAKPREASKDRKESEASKDRAKLPKESEGPKQGHEKRSSAPKGGEVDKGGASTTKPSGRNEVATTPSTKPSEGKKQNMDKGGQSAAAAQHDNPSNISVGSSSYNTVVNGEETQGSCWTVTLSSNGGFCLSDNEQEGNFRIAHCDSVELMVLAGTFCAEAVKHLIVVNPFGEESKATGSVDALGTWRMTWAAPTALAGSYELRLITADDSRKCLINTVIVEPRLLVKGREIRSSALNVQTVLSRSLGPIKRWKRMMTSPAHLGYNMLHFTPVQTPGESGSCYSIANQHEIAASFFLDSPPATLAKSEGGVQGPPTCALSEEARTDELQAAVAMLEGELGLLSSTDLVLNHTASNSCWIRTHPECGYSTTTCPYLKGACELDIAIKGFSDALVDRKFTKDFGGLHEYIANEADLGRLVWAFKEACLKKFKMYEWFQLDIEGTTAAFEAHSGNFRKNCEDAKKALMEHVTGMVGSVRGPKMVVAKQVTEEWCHSKEQLTAMLRDIQEELYRLGKETEDLVVSAIEGNVRYERLERHNCTIGKEHWQGLVPRYFTEVKDESGQTHYLANNGWVMDWDASKDFAAPGSLVYLQRRMVAWSDCIKLRYGEGPEDVPFLWTWMTKYCQQTARIFHGVRLDNCHSTPTHVAKHMLRECRRIRPNLWIYAELFTGQQKVDQLFERELGLNALIREAMQTHSSRDLGVHAMKYCHCEPLGALSSVPSLDDAGKQQLKPSLCPALFYDCTHDNETPNERRSPQDALATAAVVCASACAVGSSRGFDEMVPHQLDVVTESRLYQDYQESVAIQKTPAADSSTADTFELSWYGGSADGQVSVRGEWDDWAEDVPCKREDDGVYRAKLMIGKHLKAECQEYQYKYVVSGDWCNDPDQPCARDSHGNINNVLSVTGCKPAGSHAWRAGEPLPGFMQVKGILNRLHTEMAEKGYSEMEVESIAEDILLIRRHNPTTHACVYFVVRSAFDQNGHTPDYAMPKIVVGGKVNKCYVAANLAAHKRTSRKSFSSDPVKINGLESKLMIQTDFGDMADVPAFEEEEHITSIRLRNFPAASVLVFSTFGYGEVKEAVDRHVGQLREACADIDITAASYLLYSCGNEEADVTHGTRGVYEIPGHGKLVYSGLVGVTSLLDNIRGSPKTALQHPLCDNLRGGHWLLEYLCNRLEGNGFTEKLQKVKKWMLEIRAILEGPSKTNKGPLASEVHPSASPDTSASAAGVLQEDMADLQLPHWLRPYYFDLIVCRLYYGVQRAVLDKMGGFIAKSTDPFVHDLAMASLQFYGYVPSGSLEARTEKPSLCAGLPHFSTGFMRNWGRDTFISLKGILLVTGRFDEAKEEILGFARVVRHGLVPNLLDGGNNPRYNARDATWFFLQAVQDFCVAAPESINFLKTELELKFPLEEGRGDVKTVGDLIHHILSEHAKGISFREWNAGSDIDEHMSSDGFDIAINFDDELGVLIGGNASNCGTWMDKMGSSHKAGNKGQPATPRDGAPVEIVGLLKSTLRFVNDLPIDVFPHKDVTLSNGTSMTYKQWNDLLAKSFEKHFYVPSEADDGDAVVDTKLVNKRQIYKDVLKATQPWCDYQLRPNYCVAMAVAPELFDRRNACGALDMVEQCLWGKSQLGLKTLDPSDFTYRGKYDNADDGDDKHTAHGWNYHQGPEWLWPLGYFLQAKLLFASEDEQEACKQKCLTYLVNHRAHIRQSAWRSLPELTNENGQECLFSCPAQAWSVGTILSFLQSVVDKIA
eukprot:GHVS01097680.1.p1 GENE.GHVS01097680.1~~GHVS01097680.1.p1  ORF type:complete len:1836 (-),score=266.89 GHVS01097680.1:358-5865(-)